MKRSINHVHGQAELGISGPDELRVTSALRWRYTWSQDQWHILESLLCFDFSVLSPLASNLSSGFVATDLVVREGV